MIPDDSSFCITDRRPNVDVESLNKFNKFKVYDWFDISDIKKTFQGERLSNNIISVSFFRANVSNRNPEYDDTHMSKEDWERKYWTLPRFVDQLQTLNSSPKGLRWVLRIYMSKMLVDEGYLNKLLQHAVDKPLAHLEIYVMTNPSIGFQPGSLWRYLTFSDTSVDLCVVLDVDSDGLNPTNLGWIDQFTLQEHVTFGRYVGGTSNEYSISSSSRAVNYASVLGSFVLCKPKLAALPNISIMMKKFVYKMMVRSKAYQNPKTRFNIFETPIGEHIYGWGAHWTMYGFDERFLRQVLLYYFGKKGQLMTFLCRTAQHLFPKSDDGYFRNISPKNVTLIC